MLIIAYIFKSHYCRHHTDYWYRLAKINSTTFYEDSRMVQSNVPIYLASIKGHGLECNNFYGDSSFYWKISFGLLTNESTDCKYIMITGLNYCQSYIRLLEFFDIKFNFVFKWIQSYSVIIGLALHFDKWS